MKISVIVFYLLGVFARLEPVLSVKQRNDTAQLDSDFEKGFDRGVPPTEFLEREILYTCRYFTDLTAECLTVSNCSDKLNGRTVQVVVVHLKKTIFEYDCQGNSSNGTWLIEHGIINPGLVTYVSRNLHMPFLAFNCAFFEEAKPGVPKTEPKQRLFECYDTIDCSVRGGESPCAGGTPWNGIWKGTPETGFTGQVTSIAQDDQ